MEIKSSYMMCIIFFETLQMNENKQIEILGNQQLR
jgi:hypothetical protein